MLLPCGCLPTRLCCTWCSRRRGCLWAPRRWTSWRCCSGGPPPPTTPTRMRYAQTRGNRVRRQGRMGSERYRTCVWCCVERTPADLVAGGGTGLLGDRTECVQKGHVGSSLSLRYIYGVRV